MTLTTSGSAPAFFYITGGLAHGWLAKNPESGMRWTDRLELQQFRQDAEQVAAARPGKEGTP